MKRPLPGPLPGASWLLLVASVGIWHLAPAVVVLRANAVLQLHAVFAPHIYIARLEKYEFLGELERGDLRGAKPGRGALPKVR